MNVERLVKKAKKGNWHAFLTLALEKKDMLYYKALTFMKNEEDAADAVEEAMLQAFDSISSLKEARYFQTWLTKILIHICIDMQRKASKTVYLKTEIIEKENYSPHSKIAEEMDLKNQLDELNEEHRTVLILRYYEDLKVAEIAKILGVPEGTVKSRIYHGLKKLKRNLGGAVNYEV